MADVKKLAEELTKLTVLEVNELKNVLKDEYGIEPAAAAVAVAGPAAGGEAAGDGPLHPRGAVGRGGDEVGAHGDELAVDVADLVDGPAAHAPQFDSEARGSDPNQRACTEPGCIGTQIRRVSGMWVCDVDDWHRTT